MEKVQINNQIISMRKLVKQAKVHVINKLVKEVKRLKNKNGEEAKVSKYKRKAERLLSEISLMKKINADAVSKMALSNKDCKHMISDKSVTMENRILARLVSFGPLQKETQQFYSKFPRLVNMLPDIFQQWEVKKHCAFQVERGEKVNETQKKKEKCFKKKLSSTDSVHHEPDLNEKFNHSAEEDLPTGDILSVESEVEEKKYQHDGRLQSIQPGLDKLQWGKKRSHNEAFTKTKPKRGLKSRSTMGSKIHMNRLNLGSSSNSSSNKFKHSTKYTHKLKKLPHVEKSAMLGRTKKQETSHWMGTGANSVLKKRKKDEFSDSASWGNRKVPQDFSKPKYSMNQKSGRGSGERINCLKKAEEKMPPSLHPSWAAKRKMNMEAKINILSFQGKKVKFDE